MMKAKSANGSVVKKPKPDTDEQVADDDGFVMVLFPKDTWNKIQGIALESGTTPAEVISAALQELDRVIEEAKNGA